MARPIPHTGGPSLSEFVAVLEELFRGAAWADVSAHAQRAWNDLHGDDAPAWSEVEQSIAFEWREHRLNAISTDRRLAYAIASNRELRNEMHRLTVDGIELASQVRQLTSRARS